MKNPDRQHDVWFVDQILPHEQNLKSWLARRFTGLNDLDDIIQESYFKVLKAHASGPIINPRAYLFLTAKNLVLNRFRHFRHEKPPGDDEYQVGEMSDELDDPLEEVTKKEEIQIMIQAIKSLPKRCRQVMTLRKIYGYSLREVAKKLGISVSAVDAQSSIGLRKCAEYYEAYQFRGEK